MIKKKGKYQEGELIMCVDNALTYCSLRGSDREFPFLVLYLGTMGGAKRTYCLCDKIAEIHYHPSLYKGHGYTTIASPWTYVITEECILGAVTGTYEEGEYQILMQEFIKKRRDDILQIYQHMYWKCNHFRAREGFI